MRSLLLLFLLIGATCEAWCFPVFGTVFRDKNHNNRFDRGERLLRDVGVTNGDTIVWTNRCGRYAIDVAEGQMLSVILPDGSAFSDTGIQNQGRKVIRESADNVDFALVATKRLQSFRVAVVGDIQVDNEEQLGFAQRTVLSEVSSRDDVDFSIHMGDLVNDKPDLLPQAAASVGMLPQPAWCVIGNHDLDMDTKPRNGNSFLTVVGADVTACYRGRCCFVLLNNVENSETGIPEEQLRFLRQLVARCPADGLLVLCQHVPLSSVKNRDALLEIISHRRTLILSAHAHLVFRKEWSDLISEVSVGAACGTWWTGERDAWGIPFAIQQCGTPRNYFVFDFADNSYRFRVKGVGLDASKQADIWIKGDQSTDDTSIDLLCDEPTGSVLINVYGGGEATTVEYRIDDCPWQQATQASRIAPSVVRTIYMNKSGGYPTKFSRRQPLRKMPSPHVWSAMLPDTLTTPHVMEFRVTDLRGLEPFTCKQEVRIR